MKLLLAGQMSEFHGLGIVLGLSSVQLSHIEAEKIQQAQALKTVKHHVKFHVPMFGSSIGQFMNQLILCMFVCYISCQTVVI